MLAEMMLEAQADLSRHVIRAIHPGREAVKDMWHVGMGGVGDLKRFSGILNRLIDVYHI